MHTLNLPEPGPNRPAAHLPPVIPSSPGYPRLVGDVGGTNARFALIDGPEQQPRQVRSLRVADHAGIADAIDAYLSALDADGALGERPRAAAIALATPLAGDIIVMTNNHWRFSRTAVQRQVGLQALVLLNDFEALALALPRLGQGQLLTDRQRQPQGTVMAAVGPGTGLGVAGVMHTPAGWVALPGEGGHATLAPMDSYESALLDQVRQELPHVSAERLLSGIGLPSLYRAVARVNGQPAQALAAEQIVAHAVGCSDDLCIDTLDVFCALLGNFAGNVALTFGARAGVYIGGGIVPRLGAQFFASRFRERFEAKGRCHDYLEQIPTFVVIDTLAALAGAAGALDQHRLQ